LVSAGVSGFLAQSYFGFQTNSQDVSAFYLSQLYQLQAGLNSLAPSPIPAPPVPASEPNVSHALWFVSLVMSFVCAVGATIVQEWIRRYQLLTQLWTNPHRRSARIRASISQDGFLESVPKVLKSLTLFLHLSIYLFIAGLTFLPLYFRDFSTLAVVLVCFILALTGYFLLATGRVASPPILSRFALLPIYSRDSAFFPSILPFRVWPTLLFVERQIERHASTRTLELDANAMSWLLDSLTHEEDFERFLTGIPGFYKSTQVENPAEVLKEANTAASPKAILAFMDRSLSSDLPEGTRQRRIKISLEAMQTHPYILQRSFFHALRINSIESAIFKSVDFVLLADHNASGNNKDLNIRSLARCIVAIAINHLEDYHADERWAGIVQRRLNWAKDPFPREQRDSIKLCNLVQLARELNTLRPDSDTLRPDSEALHPGVLHNSLREACNLNAANAAPTLQNEFCDFWNQLVIAAQLPDQDPDLRSKMTLILSSIRAIHGTLHPGAESQSATSPAITNDRDPILQNPLSYSQCPVSNHPVTSANPSANILVAHGSEDT
jgi:hypothetical protein